MVKSNVSYTHLRPFFNQKRVFLTGHTGFKGAWMLGWLHLLGAEVRGYALAPENDFDLFNAINGDELCDSMIADLRDRQRLQEAILDFQPDFIFHLAAQPLVRLSYQIPVETFEINAIGTANVLEAVRKLEKSCVVVLITTDKVYENKEWHYPYRETDNLGGYDPYSASKACAELIINAYRQSFFPVKRYEQHKKTIASARAGNVIGGGDWAKDRIIPDIVRALSEQATIQVRNPHAVRPWQHVLEPIAGYLRLAAKLVNEPIKYADAWNFGPLAADNLTVKELVETAITIWGTGSYTTPKLLHQPHEAGLLRLDISKTVHELQWHPKLSSKEAIEWTLAFYKASNKRQEFFKQIDSYQT